jgi:hypothetical protein
LKGTQVKTGQPSNDTAEYGSRRVQPTVAGYTAWALERLARKKRQSLGEVASYALDRWVDDNADFLGGFGISLENFELELDQRVVRMSPTNK